MGSFRGYWEGRLQLLQVFFAVLIEVRGMKVLVRPVAGPTNLEKVYENECVGPNLEWSAFGVVRSRKCQGDG